MLRMIKPEFERDLFDRQRSGCKQNFSLQDNMVHDGFLRGKTSILLYQGIQVIGMRMEFFGVEVYRTLAATVLLDQFIKFFYKRIVYLFFILALGLRKQPIALNNQFKDLERNHEILFGQFPFMFIENIFEKRL